MFNVIAAANAPGVSAGVPSTPTKPRRPGDPPTRERKLKAVSFQQVDAARALIKPLSPPKPGKKIVFEPDDTPADAEERLAAISKKQAWAQAGFQGPAEQFTEVLLWQWHKAMVDDGYAPKTRDDRLTVIKQLFKWGNAPSVLACDKRREIAQTETTHAIASMRRMTDSFQSSCA